MGCRLSTHIGPHLSTGMEMTASRGILIKHGHSVKGAWSPTYYSWATMIQRCTNPARNNFCDYGGRGITVCERWHSFPNFLADMGERPRGTSLERQNNDGMYEQGNCEWASRKTQSRNKRNAKLTGGCVDRVRDMLRCGAKHRAIGAYFGVSHALIGHINRGVQWA